MTRTAVIGGGLSGLCAAYTLCARYQEVVLLEAEPTLGGQLQTLRSDGYVVELGAEGFVARSQALPELARALGMEDELIGQLVTRSLGYRGGVLQELLPGEAASFLGFQVARDDMGMGIRSFRRGMGSLNEAIAASLAADVEIHTGWAATSIERRAHSYRISKGEGRVIDAERVVLATSAKTAARLLGGLFGPAALQLSAASTLSSVTVSLAYDRAAVEHPLDATGLVVATEDQVHGIRAVTFTSSKFESRAPEDKVLLRVFFRPSDADLKLGSDSTFVERAASFLASAVGASALPEASWVSRWPQALPVHETQHAERVQALSDALAKTGIALAGSAFHGAGIDAAVRSARSVFERF